MDTFAIIVACLMAPLSLGFLVAGLLQLRDFPSATDTPKPSVREVAGELADSTVLLGTVTATRDVFQNWRSRPTARRFVYIGVLCLVLLIGALFLR